MVAFVKYSVMRLALFVGVLALLAVLQAGPLLALAGAVVVSTMLSYVLLRGPREAVTAQLAERVERRADRRPPTRAEQDAAAEDAAVDAAAEAAVEPRHGEGADRT